MGYVTKVMTSSINIFCQGVSLVLVSTSYHVWNSSFRWVVYTLPQAALGIMRSKLREGLMQFKGSFFLMRMMLTFRNQMRVKLELVFSILLENFLWGTNSLL